jgi:hypothetical protein
MAKKPTQHVILSPEQLDAISQRAEESAQGNTDTQELLQIAALAAASDTSAESATESNEPTVEPQAESPVATDAAANGGSELLAFLKLERQELQASTISLQQKLATAEAALAAQSAQVEHMRNIVAGSVMGLQVRMGMPAVDMSALSTEALVSQYDMLATTFKKNFPVGRVTGAAIENETSGNIEANTVSEDVVADNAVNMRRLKSVK